MQVARLARTPRSTGDGGDSAGERGLGAKMMEALLALRLEAQYSKNDILALYASNAPFGGNVVGLEAAAWRYFGREPAALSWAESATLAVLPNQPALVTPGRHRGRLQAKRDGLLRRLHAAGALSSLELRLALAEPLVGAPLSLPDDAPHLLETLRKRYPTQHRFHSTLDAALQRSAAQIVAEQSRELARQSIHNAAALIVDNQTFEVLAYVGNVAWSVHNEHGYAVDIVQRPRSTGSILKPFLYAAMLDSGQLLPHMLVPDVPAQYADYSPENFDRTFRGAVPADVALAQSLNVPAVRMLRDYGVDRFYDLLKGMGMSTLANPPNHYGLTLILGGAEGTLWDITGMHANLAYLARQQLPGRARNYRRLQLLQSEANAEDRDVAPRSSSAISPAAAWLTLNALLEVPRPGEDSNWRSFASSRKIAWKTGTSWGQRDAWAIGSTSRYTVSVWAGNASGDGRPGLTGSVAAAPIMFELHNRLPGAAWFPAPLLTMRRVEVCRNDGYLANDICEHEPQWVPANSHFDRQSPYNILVHLDASGTARVDSSCERVASMRHVGWFVLPPAQEFYYRRNAAAYRELPPVRGDCSRTLAGRSGKSVMDFLYPNADTQLYIPFDLDGRRGRAVFEAVHRDPEAVLFWHIDGRFIGSTHTYHQQPLALEAGAHVVTIVDAQGNRLERRFEVLASERVASR
jgi:penicillin-binding protein 1C